MRHEDRQAEIRRKFALECHVGGLSAQQLFSADAASLTRSYGVPAGEADRILQSEKHRRRHHG